MLVRTRPFNPALDRRFDRAFDQLSSSLLATGRRTPVVDATLERRLARAHRRPARHARATPSTSRSPAAR